MTDRSEIQARLSRVWGEPVTVTVPSTMPGGASRQTMRFTAETGGGTRDLVLRRDPSGPDGVVAMENEARAMVAAAAAGVPVPEVVDSGPSLGGHPYIVMSHIVGETIPRRLLRDEEYAAVRSALAVEFGGIAARIHSIPVADLGSLPRQDPIDALRALSDRYDTPRPAVELGIRWLRDHPRAEAPDAVVHGDLRNGNAIVGPEGIRAVLDWELVHRGDPIEDLGWLCVKAWRFGAALPVGGFGTRAQLLDGYERVAGWRPSDEQLHWWEVYGTLRWVLICRQQAAVYLEGRRNSLEHAVIGRRVCEAEFDLLLALGLTRPGAVRDPLATADTVAAEAAGTAATGRAPHDAPDADRLLAVVADSLQKDLGESLPAGSPRFMARVAANAIRIARREILLGAELEDRHRRRLGRLGFASDADLASAIRSGAAEPAEVAWAVAETVHDKLLVANPSYLGHPDSPKGE
ncbi:phosphotransferase family protein [Microbispora sp. CA-102843]|uniref:phosphotransferase family protein n=1 Tax=Microbispora sp. CA-102843 TaxID=3239952 RepID=UPI003D8E742A